MSQPVPQVGDAIYVDDVDVVHQTYIRGGIATVSEVYYEQGRAWVCVDGYPGCRWAWDHLGPAQNDLRECCADRHPGKYIMRPEHADEP